MKNITFFVREKMHHIKFLFFFRRKGLGETPDKLYLRHEVASKYEACQPLYESNKMDE